MLVVHPKNSSEIAATPKKYVFLPLVFLLAMLSAWIIIDAVLPLYGFLFPSAQIVPLSHYVLIPSRVLFPGFKLTPALYSTASNVSLPTLSLSWKETALLLSAFLFLFFCYILALRYLPQKISLRYVVGSASLLGIICVLIPVVTSPDLFSYIMYARMWTLYHLNPLATAPFVVAKDPVYKFLYWKDQPSVYGPTWIALSGLLQILANVTGTRNTIPVMVLALRLLGLLSHLWSILLVWSLGGHLQRLNGAYNPRKRMLATLAFAWNPLLLFEASVNAHNDTIMLLFLLLSLWFLVWDTSLLSYAGVALMFALATCLKFNVALLLPGLLIFLWLQLRRWQKVSVVLLVYLVTVVALYAPFWDHGAILNVLSLNPGTYRNINTIPDFLGQFFNAVMHLLGYPLAPAIGSQAERVTHTFSVGLFVLAYGVLCWQALFTRHRLHSSLQLVRWMATTWFFYCLLGAPWFWPWYAVTFFGLFALVETVSMEQTSSWNFVINAPVVRILAFSLLSSYCLVAWGVYNSFVPILPTFRWAYFRGLWIWLPIFLTLFPHSKQSEKSEA